jgi:hypothetical protein
MPGCRTGGASFARAGWILAAIGTAAMAKAQGPEPGRPPGGPGPVLDASTTRAPVVFSGGHETDPKDHGRPVVLIAAALGAPAEVFREAFRHVRPAPAGTEPDPRQVRENKAVLLAALSRYGVTNERLDTVSNYYRYVPGRGELWPTKPAAAYALLKKGAVVGYGVTTGGSGYSSPPTVTVPGLPGATAIVQLSFDKAFEKNGSVSGITVVARAGK